MKQFFLVWNPKTGYTAHKHETEEKAVKECERLANEHPTNEFFVLKTIKRSKFCSVKTENLIPASSEYADDIPF